MADTLELTIVLPEISSVTDTDNALAMDSNSVISGYPLAVSHLEIVFALTDNLSASCCCHVFFLTQSLYDCTCYILIHVRYLHDTILFQHMNILNLRRVEFEFAHLFFHPIQKLYKSFIIHLLIRDIFSIIK